MTPKILKEFELLAKSIDDEISAFKALGFEPVLSKEMKFKLLTKGWWHVLFLGYSKYGDFCVGLKVSPGVPMENWPAVLIYDMNRAVTFAPDFPSALALLKFNVINKSGLGFKQIKGRIELLNEIALPFFKLFNGEEKFKVLIDYLEDDKNIPIKLSDKSEEIQLRTNRYKSFLLKLDSSKAHHEFRKILDLMIQDKEFIPLINKKGFGAWESRIVNIIAGRAVIKAGRLDIKTLSKVLCDSFLQPHPFDPNGIIVSHYPNESYEPKMLIFEIVNLLTASYYNIPDNFSKDKFFDVVKEINRVGVDNYDGFLHYEKVSQEIAHTEDPVEVWNSLVSAAYWAGKNRKEALIPAWEAAIELSAEQGWEHAGTALKYQYEFYNSMNKI